jgi:acetate kinase
VLEDVDPEQVDAVAHRVVHGGDRFQEPVVVDADVRAGIAALEPLAPLHNPSALAGVALADRFLPGVPQVAVFDTAFHATMPPEAALYAVPERWRSEWGIRRYGFHGLSVGWSAERAPEVLGRAATGLRLVVCHLGGGCSVTAVRDGRSQDTTMGFSPLEGVPMATRAGSVDPGALLYVLRERGLDADGLERELNAESGLKGLGGHP